MMAQAQAMMNNPAMAAQAQQAMQNLSPQELKSRMAGASAAMGGAPAAPKPKSAVEQLKGSSMVIDEEVLSHVERAEALKLKGNTHFKAAEYEAAIGEYEQGRLARHRSLPASMPPRIHVSPHPCLPVSAASPLACLPSCTPPCRMPPSLPLPLPAALCGRRGGRASVPAAPCRLLRGVCVPSAEGRVLPLQAVPWRRRRSASCPASTRRRGRTGPPHAIGRLRAVSEAWPGAPAGGYHHPTHAHTSCENGGG